MENNDVNELIRTLSSLNNHLNNIADVLHKVEQNEIESIKAIYDIKGDIAGDLSDVVNKLEGIEKVTDNINEKLSEKLIEIKALLPQIQNNIIVAVEEKLSGLNLGSVKISEKCTDCVLIKQQDKLVKRQDRLLKYLLWGLSVAVLSIFALLGLKAAGIIKWLPLPG